MSVPEAGRRSHRTDARSVPRVQPREALRGGAGCCRSPPLERVVSLSVSFSAGRDRIHVVGASRPDVDWAGVFPIGSVGRGDEANFTLTVSEHKKPASTNGWALIQLVAVRLLPELYLP
jgi:hypothetical protein